MQRRVLVLAIALAFLAAPLTGCLGFGKKPAPTAIDPNSNSKKLIDNKTQSNIESRLGIPRNYTFAGTQALAPLTFFVNDSVDPSANTGFEDKNDRAGNDYNTVRKMADVTKFIPVGQPTELHITLSYANQAGNSAKCDIAVNLPGAVTSRNGGDNDQFNWKISVQRMVVNTIGVAGAKHEIGTECSDGMITAAIPYQLRVTVDYVKDAFAPGLAYGFKVPANASGVVFETVKAGGPEHLRSWFVVIGPDDNLVEFVDFNDIAIPTQSVFVPTPKPGEYVFYAYNMTGGFLALKADTPVPDRAVRILPLKETVTVDASGPAPGLAARDWLHDATVATPDAPAGGQSTNFDSGPTFPLRVTAFVGDPKTGGKTMFSDVQILSAKGLVSSLQRVMRYDDDKGSLGVSQDYFNSVWQPQNLVKGAYTVKIVNDSPDAPVGHVLVTYSRA